MPTPLTLIQLVSEQTMQNLLPVLRLRPVRLVHLATPKTRDRSARIAEAARRSNCPVDLETLPLAAMPSIKETHDAVRSVIAEETAAGRRPFVNFTGGTKLMSIGAYAAALKDQIPSLYVDTQDATFMDGRTGPGLDEVFDGDLSFTPILRTLTVHAIACANGCDRVTGGRDWRPHLPLAEHLLANPADEQATHLALHGPNGLFPHGREPRTPGDWLQCLDLDFTLPSTVQRLALDSGILEPGHVNGTARLPSASRTELEALAAAGHRRLPNFRSRLFEAIAPLQQSISRLTGGWWEIILASRAHASGRFRDLRWSVQVGEKGGADLEEDIVALDGVQVTCIACKRGGHKSRLLPLLEEITARARTLGGTFNRRFLAVCHPPKDPHLKNLQTRAEALGVRLLFPLDLQQPDPFA
ncbi:MAG: DUF1887 family protein [Verrucomicrobiae bacterium]|nr:DUF1887 family protein [Verrucomicrobiae bacterium]